ncbi:integrase catalytic domain-containing protein [Nephila pilipes]|uniref:Integrase catalytic domain-containing protein n=1 Tax=Nephila pilipes TaxID=299642 RepID=A0A8X6QRK0_NEPPI|nr:integrase catalytic domain-containing protein [Nephila pilipes]
MQEKLGNNKEVALRHLKGLVDRFKRDPVLCKEYREVVDGYLEGGIVEWCITKGLYDESSFYLPHHAVIREDKLGAEQAQKTQKDKTIEAGYSAPTKVLGLAWDLDKDMIFFHFRKLINILANGCRTKRFILQILGRIFDPIGFLGPFIIRLKILFQELWAAEIDCDDKLPFYLDCKWQLRCSELKHLNNFEILRYYFSKFNLYDFI